VERLSGRSRRGEGSWDQRSGKCPSSFDLSVPSVLYELTPQSQLVEVGYNGLTQLFLKIAKDGLSKFCDPQAMLISGKPQTTIDLACLG
jgi:hypothetical protein